MLKTVALWNVCIVTVVYSSVICWSALMSRFILKKHVSKEEWMGIALVTFGLAFSALGGSNSDRKSFYEVPGLSLVAWH